MIWLIYDNQFFSVNIQIKLNKSGRYRGTVVNS